MSQFIQELLSINDHPVMVRNRRHRKEYVRGLVTFVSCITDVNDSKVKAVLTAWGQSIFDNDTFRPEDVRLNARYRAVTKCLGTKFEWFKFFTMRDAFLFDCLYLVEKTKPDLMEKAYSLLKDVICNTSSQKILQCVYDWFKGNEDTSGLPKPLVRHRMTSLKFMKQKTLRVLVVATMSAGKSTLINAITGSELNKMKSTACTSQLAYLYNKPCEDGIIMETGKGNYVYQRHCPRSGQESPEFRKAAFHFDSVFGNRNICIIDSPGENSRIGTHGTITRKAIADNRYDLLLFVINGNYYGTTDENYLLDYVLKNTQKPIIFVINKLDTFDPSEESIADILNDFTTFMTKRGKKPVIVPVSALAGLLAKLERSGLSGIKKTRHDLMKKNFADPFYDMPSYTGKTHSLPDDMLTRSGILELENKILQS